MQENSAHIPAAHIDLPDGRPSDADAEARARPRWVLRGVIVGLVAAAVGLGIAELLAGLNDSWRSPVLDVGDRVIDRVPNAVKRLAIEWFGTNDKRALLVGIGSILGIYAVVIGFLSVRRSRIAGAIGIAAFGVVGAAAAITARTSPGINVAVPSIVGAVAAAATVFALVPGTSSRRNAETQTSTDDEGAESGLDRRRFVVLGSALTGLAVASAATGRWLQAGSNAVASRASLVLPRAARRLSSVPESASADGAVAFFTPNPDFYRIDINLSVPDIPIDDWSLRIHGMVDRETTLDFDALVAHEVVESDITLTCVSNEVGGRLLGTARWSGVRLDDLLAEVGVVDGADQVVGRSIDGYTCGFPLAALDGRDALVAFGMNGEPLPLEHGFPVRLIVPGLYGYVSATKWLTEIEMTRFDDFDQYWVNRGWDATAPIKTSSRIDTPRGLAKVPAGTVPIAGVAWAQTRGIETVEVRIDDGDWREARLADEVNDVTWRQWSYAWDAEPGRHEVTVRAVDRTGTTQSEERREPFPNGSEGWHRIVVLVE